VLGVAHLHNLNIVHGDISAKNLLLSEERVLVSDFGSCADASDNYFDLSAIATYAYRAPEHWMPPTLPRVAVDMFALGNVAFWMWTGNFPFHVCEKDEDSKVEMPPTMVTRLGGVPASCSLRQLDGWSSFEDLLAAGGEALEPAVDAQEYLLLFIIYY